MDRKRLEFNKYKIQKIFKFSYFISRILLEDLELVYLTNKRYAEMLKREGCIKFIFFSLVSLLIQRT